MPIYIPPRGADIDISCYCKKFDDDVCKQDECCSTKQSNSQVSINVCQTSLYALELLS